MESSVRSCGLHSAQTPSITTHLSSQPVTAATGSQQGTRTGNEGHCCRTKITCDKSVAPFSPVPPTFHFSLPAATPPPKRMGMCRGTRDHNEKQTVTVVFQALSPTTFDGLRSPINSELCVVLSSRWVSYPRALLTAPVLAESPGQT